MRNQHHKDLLEAIEANSGQGTSHTSKDNYLGTSHRRYEITLPVLRLIAKEWSSQSKHLSCKEFTDVITSLIQAESFTEKLLAGILLGYCTAEQRQFNPSMFKKWLSHAEGWAETDTLCTGPYTIKQVPKYWEDWETLLISLSKANQIEKRRASLVFLCSPVSHSTDVRLRDRAFINIDLLKGEKDILITKAISWLLRSLIKNHKLAVKKFVDQNVDTLPKIAIRETRAKLEMGTKTKSKKPRKS